MLENDHVDNNGKALYEQPDEDTIVYSETSLLQGEKILSTKVFGSSKYSHGNIIG